jgi:hypothetical protein
MKHNQIKIKNNFVKKWLLFFMAVLVVGLLFSLGLVPVAQAATTWYVDDDNCPGPGAGTLGDPYCSIQDAITAASPGDTINVAAGTYAEGVTLTPGTDLTIVGAGRDLVTWLCPSGSYCLGGSMSGYTGSMNYEISGFTFNVRSDSSAEWGAGIQINRASAGPLNLSIHDNRFIEDRTSGDDAHWGTSMLLCHNRYAGRDGSGNPAVRVYNNIDETWGGMTISNSQAYDIYNNVFDGASDAIYNGHGCPDIAGQTFGDHHIYGNIFKNASDALHPGGLTPAIDWQYYGAGGATHLPSIIEENVFEDNDTAIRFVMDTDMTYPAHIVRNNSFVNNGVAIRIDGTYASTLNASGNWWGTNDPTGVAAEVSGSVDYTPWLADGTDTSADPGFQGDFSELWVDDDSPQTGSTGRVQEGIDMVSGSIVNVAAGTYVEQVEISQDLTLKGAGSGTVVQSPDTLTKYFITGSNNNYPVIYVHDVDDVTIQDLVVDGAGKGNSNYRFNGIAYYNAGGTVDSVEIRDVRDTLFSGAQHGVALYAYNADGTPRSLTVSNCNIHDFQKNAMALNASPTTSFAVDVRDNQVTGYGPTPVTAQNGIQVWADQGTGTVADNTVTGIAYSGSGWVASTILNYYADLNIIGNTTSNGHVGVYNIDGAGQINSNDITVIKAGGYAWGIIATDPPQAVPSPFDADVMENASVASAELLSTASVASTLNVEVSNNTVTFSGSDNAATYGIEADAGYGTNDLAFIANNNLVSGFEMGIVAYKCQSNCAPGVFTSFAATYNSLADNTIGMYSNVSDLEADGTCNWWGDDSGPSGVGPGSGSQVTDYIDYTPWLMGGWPDGKCEEPTAISLASFEVEANDGRVMVMWETGTEIDNAGFNLYRAASLEGPWYRVNPGLIAAEGDPVSGASYTFVDRPGRGAFYYRLEDMDYFGSSTLHEPVLAELGAPVRVPWFRPLLPEF